MVAQPLGPGEFRPHLAPFHVLERGRDIRGLGGAGSTPGTYDTCWKDTVYSTEQRASRDHHEIRGVSGQVRLSLSQPNLEHENMVMMANIQVVLACRPDRTFGLPTPLSVTAHDAETLLMAGPCGMLPLLAYRR